MKDTPRKNADETPDGGFSSARNPGGQKKPVSDEALANEKQRINVPFDAHAWDDIKGLDNSDRDALKWFHLHCLDKGMTGTQIGAVLGVHRTNASRILRGVYNVSDWLPIVARIEQYREAIKPVATIGGIDHEPDFVPTSASRLFWQGLDYASRGGFSVIAGPSGAGKTKTTDEWTRRNPGRLIRLNVPAVGSHVALIRKLARALGMAWRKRSVNDLMLSIVDRLDPRNILFFDQGTRLLPRENHIQARSLELLMDLSEESGCGIVIALTARDVERMGNMQYQIEQITGRAEIFSAASPTVEQIAEIAGQFGEFNAQTIRALHDLALKHGALRSVVKVLNLAERAARAEGKKPTSHHVAGAIQIRFENMGGIDLFNERKKHR